MLLFDHEISDSRTFDRSVCAPQGHKQSMIPLNMMTLSPFRYLPAENENQQKLFEFLKFPTEKNKIEIPFIHVRHPGK